MTEMMNLGEQMMEQFEEERKMWKAFVSCIINAVEG